MDDHNVELMWWQHISLSEQGKVPMARFIDDGKDTILEAYIRLQLVSLPYSHESNIESSLEYERKLEEIYPDHFVWMRQSYDPGHIKLDCMYNPTKESLEIKTTFKNFNKKDNYIRITWTKVKGEVGGFEHLAESCPNGLLFYRKFNLHRRDPAMLGYVSGSKLLSVLSDESCVKWEGVADIEIKLHRDDFSWLIQRSEIPKVDDSDSLIFSIQDLDNQYKSKLAAKRMEILDRHLTNDVFVCDVTANPFDNNKLSSIRTRNLNRLRQYADEGKTLEQIFHLLNSRWGTFVKKHYNEYMEYMQEKGSRETTFNMAL